MAKQTRTTLKEYFQSGDVPTEAQFADLIDSELNITEDTLDDVSAGSTNKHLTSTEKDKLGTVEENADVTDTTNVDAAGATMNTDADVLGNSWVLDEDDFASDSDTKVPTQQSAKKYVDDKASLLEQKDTELEGQIEAASKGIKPFETKADMDAFTPGDGGDDRELAKVYNDPTSSNNGEYNWNGTSWIKDSALTDVETIKSWVTSEAFDLSAITYSDDGNVATADLLWPDSEAGTISDLSENSDGLIASLRFNRPSAKYITVDITYDADGNILTTTLTATGY